MTLSKSDIEAIGQLLDTKMQPIESKIIKHLENFNYLVAKLYEIDATVACNEYRLWKLERAASENELIIFNMDDTGSIGEDLIGEIMHVIDSKLDGVVNQMWINDAYRIGKRMTGKNRPIILRVASRRIVNSILANVSKLKGCPVVIRQNRPYTMQLVTKQFKDEIKTAYMNKKKVGWQGAKFMIDGIVKYVIGQPRLHQKEGDLDVRRKFRTSTPLDFRHDAAAPLNESMESQAR